MKRLALLLSISLLGVGLLAAGCGGGGSTPASGSGGQTGTGGMPAGGSGGASVGSGGAGSGSGGAPAGSGGSGGQIAPGSGGATAGDAGGDGPGTDTPPSPGCPAGAIICEDFEKYPSGAIDLSPDWLAYKYGGATLTVDATKPFQGARSLHLTAPTGGRKYADIIKQNAADKELLPIKHYGRVMVWVSTLPSAAHWNINQAGGPMASNANLIAKYSFGGQNSVLSPNYTQRAPVGNGLTPLRGGGPEDGDPNPPPVDCGPNAQTQALAIGRWVCWEWMFDGTKNQVQIFLDGAEQTQAGVIGVPGMCGGWQGPARFTKMILGWEQYTTASDKVQNAWLDDLIVSGQRVGCPAP